MKTLPSFPSWLIATFLLLGLSARAETTAASDKSAVLTVVIVESLMDHSLESSPYERLARVFTEALEAKKWPLKIETERLAANAGPHPLELRVFFKRITRDMPDTLTFRGWMTFQDHGTKHDFGVVRFDYSPRAGQQMDDSLDAVVRGAADLAAQKIDGLLFHHDAKH